ncbi:nicotinamidase [Candidatus Gottesmanbacteria bacterium RBG_13_37_7]|uniref:Nicotinamidase n=1 Tax=Candidatus Gottesmanbacteria bacterium RBG_13_37_7 TaxID=1798369 RepID=A0A1F5YGQ1_9BACT|nr:MAG: nicotinamidase [Candidatus Gottesmanbacteria bacterium RBG_13_37_7]
MEVTKKVKKAVIVIDMLEDFVYGALKNERSKRIIPQISRLLQYARKKGWLVIYSNDAHFPGDPEEKVWGVHAVAGSKGAQVIEELKPQKGDFELPKRTYSAFHETGLDLLLRQHGVKEVIITGQHTHICVRHTSADAFFRNYEIVVPEDGVESFMDEDHERGLEYLKMAYKANVVKTEDIIKNR